MNAIGGKARPLDHSTLTCRNCGIVPAREWNNVPDAIVDALNTRKAIRTLPKGTFLFHEGDEVEALYRLLSGVVLLRKGDGLGNTAVTRLLSPRATIGFRPFMDGVRHPVSAQCASEVVVCSIPVGAVELAFPHNRPLERVFAQHLAEELSYAETQVIKAATLSVRERLLLTVEELAQAFGTHPAEGGVAIPLPVTRTDLAAIVGIARETLSRTIKTLQAENVMLFERDRVVVPSFQAFAAELTAIRREEG